MQLLAMVCAEGDEVIYDGKRWHVGLQKGGLIRLFGITTRQVIEVSQFVVLDVQQP